MQPVAATAGSSQPICVPPIAAVGAGRRRLAALLVDRDVWTLLALFSVWLFCNPFFEIDSSTLIYTGRTLADLDPNGVGRDVMFRYDGQSGFTIFTPVLRWLGAAIGLSGATLLIAALSVVAGFAGAAVFAGRLASRRTRILAIVFAATLPACYGGFKLFSYAEVAATPRPFAEALVLCALAALVSGRTLVAAVGIGAAMLLHPIMALPGLGVLLLWLAIEDRRWALAILLLALAALAAGALGAAPFDRLFERVDPEWKAILVARSPQLFPDLWPSGWSGRFAARAATLLIAAALVGGPMRRLFLCTLAVCLAGFATAYALNDTVGSLLLLQAQTWRVAWLAFAMATFAAALCAIELWQRGGTARIALAFLALAWAFADYDTPALACAAGAVGTHFAIDPATYRRFAPLLSWVTALLLALAACGFAASLLAYFHLSRAVEPDLVDEARRTIALGLDYSLLAVLAAASALVGARRIDRRLLLVVAAIVGAASVARWDQRSAANAVFDTGGGAADLAQLVAERPGEVFWLDGGREAWWWLHRPQWLATIQGAGIVFSRDLGLLFQDRARRAIAAGLADESIVSPLTHQAPRDLPALDPVKLASFCAAADAPAWIIASLPGTEHLPAGVSGREWEAPVPRLVALERHGDLDWTIVSRYGVVACAGRT